MSGFFLVGGIVFYNLKCGNIFPVILFDQGTSLLRQGITLECIFVSVMLERGLLSKRELIRPRALSGLFIW